MPKFTALRQSRDTHTLLYFEYMGLGSNGENGVNVISPYLRPRYKDADELGIVRAQSTDRAVQTICVEGALIFVLSSRWGKSNGRKYLFTQLSIAIILFVNLSGH